MSFTEYKILIPIMTQTLDQIEQTLEKILDLLDSDDPEENALAEQFYQELEPKLEKKLDSYVGLIRFLENRKEFRLKEAERIKTLAKQDDNKLKFLKGKLLNFMERRAEELGSKGKKLEGKFCKISLANNGGKNPVWINDKLDADRLPEEYKFLSPSIDKHKLKEDAYKQGEIFDDKGQLIAKVMPKGKHLRFS